MSSYQELHSFFSKFVSLLHCGKSAKLVLECHQGQAHVNLHHALTLLPEEPHRHHPDYGHPVRRQGPSRQRRRDRRALARAAAAKAAKAGAKADNPAQTSDVAAQATVDKAGEAFPSHPTYHQQEQADQAVQACPPPHREQAVQASPPPHISTDQTFLLDDNRAAHLEPVCDIFCNDSEYSAGQAAPLHQAIPQVDGFMDLSTSTLPSFSWATAGLQQYLDGRSGRNREQEEEERKKEREKDLEYIKNLVQKI